MKTPIHHFIISFLLLTIIVSCDEEKKNPVQPQAAFPCLEYLDSNTFDLKTVVSQRLNVNNNQTSGDRVTQNIDENSQEFSSLAISNDGKKIQKITKRFTYPERDFKIEKNIMYFGDDQSIITSCSQDGFTIMSYDDDFNSQDNTVTGLWATFQKRK